MAWVGFDQPRTLGRNETGGSVSLPIWIGYMEKALKGIPEVARTVPDGIIDLKVDPDAAVPGSGSHPEFFYKEGMPPVPAERAPGDAPQPDFKPVPSMSRNEPRPPPAPG